MCQKWEWMSSTREPDGVSLHPDAASIGRFVTAYWQGMPERVPPKYSRPFGEPYPLGVSEAVKEEVEASGDGIRIIYDDFPGSGGVDGYMPPLPKQDKE